MVRTALATDVDRVVQLCEAAYHRLEVYRDPFYATGPKLAEQLRGTISQQVNGADTVAFVHEDRSGVNGFLGGFLFNAPPVYAPGGKVCLIDLFAVAELSDWPIVGAELVQASNLRIKELGGVLSRIECRANDAYKRKLLTPLGFTVASDWFYRDTDLAAPSPAESGEIVLASVADVPAIVELCEQNRQRYQAYQPVFWRKAADSAAKQAPYLQSLIEASKQIVLVHKSSSKVDGVIIADVRTTSSPYDHRGTWCTTDDFALASEAAWDTVGVQLLHESVKQARSQGATSTQVICGHAHEPKSQMLRNLGYAVGHEWLVRPSSGL